MRTSTIPTVRETPAVKDHDPLADFQRRLLGLRDEFEREMGNAQHTAGLSGDDKADRKLLTDIERRFVRKERQIYYGELASQFTWSNNYGGSSTHNPQIVLLQQTVLFLMERLDELERRLDK
jgi:hypothetical protein